MTKKIKWTPGKLLEISGSYWKTCTLHTGVKLGIFSLIEPDGSTADFISQQLKADKRAVPVLLNALASMGLITKNRDIYFNTPESEKFLSRSSADYIGFMIMHHHHLMDSWLNMDQAIISGKPVRARSSHHSDERRESFLMGMFNIAMSIAPRLSKTLDLKGCTRLLDFGGGPGTYAIHFCLENPDLRATVCDLPTTRPFAEKTIERFGLSKRINFKDFNYIKEDFDKKGQYDAAWLSHVLHGESPEDARKIIGKAVSALKPGAKVFIHDFILDNTMDGPEFPALFSINMLLGTPGGQSYSEQQIKNMMASHGVKDITRLDFKGPTESGIMTGRV